MRNLDVALGFDLGTANLGWAAIQKFPPTDTTPRRLVVLGCGVVHTHKDATAVRVTHDDKRRLETMSRAVNALVVQYSPGYIGYESYAVFDDTNNDDMRQHARKIVGLFGHAMHAGMSAEMLRQALATSMFEELLGAVAGMGETLKHIKETRGRGAAAKVLAVQGMVCEVGFRTGIPTTPFTPADLKRRAINKPKGSKEDVEVGLNAIFPNLATAILPIPPSHRNHAVDAVGHALLALERGDAPL